MPAAYTHFSVAAEVFRRLPEEIRGNISSLRLYFFGAQVADYCFFYRAFRASEINFGRFLHNRGSFDFFKALLLFSDRNSDLFSYALGYITHYAADCIFHPYVYYLSGHSPVNRFSILFVILYCSFYIFPGNRKTRRTEVLRVSYVWTQRYLAITNLYSDCITR